MTRRSGGPSSRSVRRRHRLDRPRPDRAVTASVPWARAWTRTAAPSRRVRWNARSRGSVLVAEASMYGGRLAMGVRGCCRFSIGARRSRVGRRTTCVDRRSAESRPRSHEPPADSGSAQCRSAVGGVDVEPQPVSGRRRRFLGGRRRRRCSLPRQWPPRRRTAVPGDVGPQTVPVSRPGLVAGVIDDRQPEQRRPRVHRRVGASRRTPSAASLGPWIPGLAPRRGRRRGR